MTQKHSGAFLGTLLLLMAIGGVRAQTTAGLERGRSAVVPRTDSAYRRVDTLIRAGLVAAPPRDARGVSPAVTRQQFGAALSRLLHNTERTSVRRRFAGVMRQHPDALLALTGLLDEFAPEVGAQGQDVAAAKARLAAIAQQPADAPGQTPASEIRPFTDVPPDHWAAQAVETLHQRGVVVGYPAGSGK